MLWNVCKVLGRAVDVLHTTKKFPGYTPAEDKGAEASSDAETQLSTKFSCEVHQERHGGARLAFEVELRVPRARCIAAEIGAVTECKRLISVSIDSGAESMIWVPELASETPTEKSEKILSVVKNCGPEKKQVKTLMPTRRTRLRNSREMSENLRITCSIALSHATARLNRQEVRLQGHTDEFDRTARTKVMVCSALSSNNLRNTMCGSPATSFLQGSQTFQNAASHEIMASLVNEIDRTLKACINELVWKSRWKISQDTCGERHCRVLATAKTSVSKIQWTVYPKQLSLWMVVVTVNELSIEGYGRKERAVW